MRERVIGPPPAEAKDPALCWVDGCPLLGVFGAGGGRWTCAVHDNLAPQQVGAATYAVQVRVKVFEVARKLLDAAPGEPVPESTIAALRQRVPDFKGATASCRQYGQSLMLFLLQECRPAIAAHSPLSAALSTPRASDFLEGM